MLLSSGASGQEVIWTKTYGGWAVDQGFGICSTTDGGFVLTGQSNSYGTQSQALVVKTDSNGDTLWTNNYGGYGWDQGNSIQQTSDGGYVVAGWTTSYGDPFAAYLIRTDSAGDTLWTRTYITGYAADAISVRQTSEGGYILVGSTYSMATSEYDVYLVKTDPSGEVEWSKTYGGNRDDRGFSVAQTTDGGYIVCGYTQSFASYSGVYLIKTDSQGDTVWTRAYDASGCYMAVGEWVQQTLDGGYIITGNSICYPEPGHYDLILIKTNANGDILWTRHYGEQVADFGNAVQQTPDSGYIAVGMTQSFGADNKDLCVIKTDENGDSLWTRTYGGGAEESGSEMVLDSAGNYIVLGLTRSWGAGDSDFYLLKIDPLAQFVRGDGNGDGVVNTSDVVYLINYLFRDGPSPEPLIAGDANCDVSVDAADVIYLINYLFAGGPKPGCMCA
jgi:regulation of enolase protein 1 (concanavalin A-like superfamily)